MSFKTFFQLKVLIAIFITLVHLELKSQDFIGCGSDLLLEASLIDHPERVDKFNEFRLNTIERISVNNKNNSSDNNVIRIPVVFHLIGNNVCSQAPTKIDEQIDILNEDFRKVAGSLGDGDGVDTKIEFCLATFKPNGTTPSTGITYHYDNPSDPYPTNWTIYNHMPVSPHETKIKSTVQWDPNKFLNIWVVEGMQVRDASEQYLGELFGFASWPFNLATSPERDCVVLNLGTLGKQPGHPDGKTEGRVLTHEIGHWLNLFHVWGPYGNSSCAEDDDVDDTPICSNPKWTASPVCAPLNQCVTENNLVGSFSLRPIENYMDYSDDGCMNAFTQGQKERMRDALITTRRSIIENSAKYIDCLGGHCNNNVQDFDETGVDCGGASCQPCLDVFNGGYASCSSIIGHSRLYVANGQNSLQKIAIICHKSPSLHHYCKWKNTSLPDAYSDYKSSDLCDEYCEDGNLIGSHKCYHNNVFFAIQEVDFNYTPTDIEHSRYIEAIESCDYSWEYGKPDFSTFKGTTLPKSVNALIGNLPVTIEYNKLYKVKLAGNYREYGTSNIHWRESATYFYPMEEIFNVPTTYQLSKGFGKKISIEESLNYPLDQTYSAQETIELLPGAEISTQGKKAKLLEIASFSCTNSPYSAENEAPVSQNFIPAPYLFSKNTMEDGYIEVYPNPSKGGIINISSNDKEIISINIYTVDGIGIAEYTFLAEGNDNKYTLNLSSLHQKGIYLLKIRCSDGITVNKRLILE